MYVYLAGPIKKHFFDAVGDGYSHKRCPCTNGTDYDSCRILNAVPYAITAAAIFKKQRSSWATVQLSLNAVQEGLGYNCGAKFTRRNACVKMLRN